MGQSSNSSHSVSSEQGGQRRMVVGLVVVAVLVAAAVGYVFRGELFGDGDKVAATPSVLIEASEEIGAICLSVGDKTVDLVRRGEQWFVVRTSTLADASMVKNLLGAIRAARLDGSPLATNEAQAKELGVGRDSPGVIGIWWGATSNDLDSSDPKIFVQHGKFRLAGSFDVHRFGLDRISANIKEWNAKSISVLSEVEAESVSVIQLDTLVEAGHEVEGTVWRVERGEGGVWREVAHAKRDVIQARIASCLFYAQSMPVLDVRGDLSVKSHVGPGNAWTHRMMFESPSGKKTWVWLSMPLGDQGRPSNGAWVMSGETGGGAYAVGEVQAAEFAPSLQALIGEASARVSVVNNSGERVDVDGKAWQGIDPKAYLFAVYPSLSRRFPTLIPTTMSLEEAREHAAALIVRMSIPGAAPRDHIDRLAASGSLFAGPGAMAPTLADHPNGIPPQEVIDAAKALQPGHASSEPIDAEDGTYVILRVR